MSLERSALEESIKTKGRDPDGLLDSVAYIKELIGQEVAAGIPEDRVVVGGFSQGGQIALRTFLDQVPPLAGCAAMSTWLGSNQTLASEQIKERPVFLAHGSADPLLPSFLAQKSYDELQRLGMFVEGKCHGLLAMICFVQRCVPVYKKAVLTTMDRFHKRGLQDLPRYGA